MVPPGLVAEHLLALAVVWGWALAAGPPLAALARVRPGFPAAALLGLAYWAAVLFLFPFPHGLDVAAVLAAAGCAFTLYRRRPPLRLVPALLEGRATWLLLVGCGAYGTLLLTQYVPPGMDASMHATGARLIARQGGLPPTYAPFAPGLHFPAVNLALPTLGAVAVRCGCPPASAMLACEQLSFSALVLGAYLLLRRWAGRTPAALLAVFAAWTARNAQETVLWGGFPTVAGVGLGLFAVRQLVELARRPCYRAALPLGLTVAALPLVHGVSAGVWAYAAAPVAVVVALRSTRRPRATLGPLALAAGITGLVLLAYALAGHARATEADVAWTRAAQAEYGPRGEGWGLLWAAGQYVKSGAGSAGVWPGLAALAVLLARRRLAAAAAVAAAAGLLCLVVANARHGLLPLSMVLYPDRAVYFATPLAAVALALAWRAAPEAVRRSGRVRAALVAGLVAAACFRHVAGYQRHACRPVLSDAAWQALRWSARHLDPRTDLVAAPYNSAGSYLPAVAGVATTGWHVHLFSLAEAAEVLRHRAVTHRLLTAGEDPRQAGEVVFRERSVSLVRLAPGRR